MSSKQNKWMLVGGVALAATIALWFGVPPATVLIVGILLLCPAAMYFGMRQMNQGSKRNTMERKDIPSVDRKPEDREKRQV